MMNRHEQNTQMGMGSGLTRYRSAPSSYLGSLLSGDGGFGADDFAQLINPRASSPETQIIFSRFMNGPSTSNMPPQNQQQRSNDYSSASQIMYTNHNSEAAASDVYKRPAPALIRHSSSPAGLFANVNIQNEFKTMRGVGSFSANADASFSSASKLMSPIQEMGSKEMGENAVDGAQLDEDHGNGVDYITDLPVNSWDASVLLSDHYAADEDNKIFFNANPLDDQKNDAANQPKTLLSHHLSLPKELSAMEKMLQDSVPCKMRAKRGCATHPRSIAERVRRTKISERMRKLQELVPNMEKQTNTSDMLDLAVDYIKELRKQIKTLSDNQAKCNCLAKRLS